MNILILAKYSTVKSGNFIASLLELSLKLRNRGNKVFFMFPKQAIEHSEWISWLEENGFTVSFLDDSRSSKEIVNELILYTKKWDINLIHCHFSFCLKELSLNISKFNGVKLLIHDHMDYSRDKNICVQYIKQYLLSIIFRIKKIGVISVMKKKANGYKFCGKNRVWYLANGLSFCRNVKFTMGREEMRKQLNILDTEQLILVLGWDMYGKGVDIAIRAVEKLHNSNPKIVLGLIGFGKQPSLLKCNWMRERTGIDPLTASWIRFFPDIEDIFSCHMAADTYLSSSRREAFSYGLLESISQNVPVVISDVEGTLWAQEYSKCFSYSVEDFNECAEKLEKALLIRKDPSNSSELVAQYSIDTWCENIIKIYDKMF